MKRQDRGNFHTDKQKHLKPSWIRHRLAFSLSLSVCLSLTLTLCLSPSVCLSLSLFLSLSLTLSLCLSVSLSLTHSLSVSVSLCLFLCSAVSLSLSVSLSFSLSLSQRIYRVPVCTDPVPNSLESWGRYRTFIICHARLSGLIHPGLCQPMLASDDWLATNVRLVHVYLQWT